MVPSDHFWLPKMVLSGPLLAAKNGPPPDHFWYGPLLPKVVLAGPDLATKTGLGGHFWQLKAVLQTSLGCYKWSWFPILTAEKVDLVYAWNINRKDKATRAVSEYS